MVNSRRFAICFRLSQEDASPGRAIVMCGISLRIRCRRHAASSSGCSLPSTCCDPPSLCSRCHHTSQPNTMCPIDVAALSANIGRRGPDVTCTTSRVVVERCSAVVELSAQGSVLSLRGTATGGSATAQPYSDASATQPAAQHSSWLLWNGEVFGGSTVQVPDDTCDTSLVYSALRNAEDEWASSKGAGTSLSAATSPSTANSAQDGVGELHRMLCAVLEGIHGPFSIIYYVASAGAVLYGRDPVGRRSLVVHRELHTAATKAQSSPSTSASGSAELVEAMVVPAEEEEEVWFLSSVAAPHVAPTTSAMLRGDSSSTLASSLHAHSVDTAPCADGGDDHDDATASGCWEEVRTGGLFLLCLNTLATGFGGLRFCKWQSEHHSIHPALRGVADVSKQVPLLSSPLIPLAIQHAVDSVAYHFSEACDSSPASARLYLGALAVAVDKRINPHTTGDRCSSSSLQRAPVALLFSGGIDSTVLAALVHFLLPYDTPIELINVAFGAAPEQTPDRIACVLAIQELLRLPHHTDASRHSPSRREWRLVLVDVPPAELEAEQSRVLDLIYPRTSVMDHNIGCAVWFAARGYGACYQLLHSAADGLQSATSLPAAGHKLCRFATATNTKGPADALVITCDTDDAERRYLPLIEALVEDACSSGIETAATVLLSTLGKEYGAVLTPVWRALGYKKLGMYLHDAERAGWIRFGGAATSKSVSLCRQVDLEEVRRRRQQVSQHDIRALDPFLVANSVAACSSGAPPILAIERAAPYRAQSKVLLLGMGADETLGGYTRYRRVYQRFCSALGSASAAWDSVTAEMQRDFSRLWTRNLGRDDRVVSDHGREGRFPFLDEDVLDALQAIASGSATATIPDNGKTPCSTQIAAGSHSMCTDILDVSLPEGVGDKKLLRTCARMLGLPGVARLQKRAIQFGTRVADRHVSGSANLVDYLPGGAAVSLGKESCSETTAASNSGCSKRSRE